MIYGYIRVSSDKQTVENQRFEINNFCAKNTMIIDRLYHNVYKLENIFVSER